MNYRTHGSVPLKTGCFFWLFGVICPCVALWLNVFERTIQIVVSGALSFTHSDGRFRRPLSEARSSEVTVAGVWILTLRRCNMRKLLAKIRKILKDRRTRQLLTRTVSVTAAIVVFVTTYALVLPAITMEAEADCGIEAHQHDSSCYEERLICDIPESDGHQHTASCYEKILICGKEVHTHSIDCYSPAQNTSSSWSTEYVAVAATDSAAVGVTVQTFMDDVEILEDDSFTSSAFSTSSTADSESDDAADLYATFSEDIDATSDDAAGTDHQLPETIDSPLVDDSPLSVSDSNTATETDTLLELAKMPLFTN